MAAATKGTASVEWQRPGTTNSICFISMNWTSNSSGKVTKVLGDNNSSWDIGGTLTKVVTNPGSTAPTSGHLVTLLDEDGVDIFNTLGALSSSATVTHYVQCSGKVTGVVQQTFRGLLTLTITGAGTAKIGKTTVYFR